MAVNKSPRNGVRFKEPAFLPPISSQTYSPLTSHQSLKNISILDLSQRQSASKSTTPNHPLHKYTSQSSIPSPLTNNLQRQNFNFTPNLPRHEGTRNLQRHQSTNATKFPSRHDMDLISSLPPKDAEQPKNNKMSYPSPRRHQLHPLQQRQSNKPKRGIHRYSSLPIQPIRQTADDRSVDDSFDVFGQSINGRLQKIHQQNPRSIHSRFELIEDRFLTINAGGAENPSPRSRPMFHSQPSLSKSYPLKEAALKDTGSSDSFEHIYTHQCFTSTIEPKVRFRKAVRLIILLLRAIFTTRERIQRQEKERKLSMWINLSASHMTSKRAYETYGISFDPQDFKANRQIQVTPEARNILCMDPTTRSSQQLHAVLVSLRQAVPEFSEFPINMQQSLARVGRYERFSAKRVIIRQGHLADNFYFILSGTAVVTLLEIDKVTEEQRARTAAVLGRGKSFGELALMHKARRSATVTCRDDVELLSVGREDFVDIFMHVDRGVEPEHIRFLRKLPMLRGWPLHVLPNDNPKVVLFTYVRRGVVLCQDSNSSDWIFIIKSGSCRIIKALTALPTQKMKRSTPVSSNKRRAITPMRPRSCHTGKSLTRIDEESASITDDDRSSYNSGEADDQDLRLSGRYRDRSAHGKRDHDKKSGLQYIQSLDAIIDQTHDHNKDSNDELEKDLQEELNSERSTKPCIFVQVLKLGPKDIYGLESSVFNNMKKTISTSLVSDGAEMIMVKRKFFMDNTSSELKKRMIKEIHPLPTEESLQNQLQNRVEWESYRTMTLQKTMADMRLIDTYSPRR